MGFGQKSIQAPATNHLAKRHVAGACGGTGDSDCVARTLTNYTSTYLDNWPNVGGNSSTVDYILTINNTTYSRSTSTLTVNFSYTIINVSTSTCSNNNCASYPVVNGMQINVIFTDDYTNQYDISVPLGNNGYSVTLGVAYTNTVTISNVTPTPTPGSSHTWTIIGDNSSPIYNGPISNNYNNYISTLIITSSYSADPVQFSFTVN